MMGGWGGFGILGWVTMLAFWILLILGVIALIRYLGGWSKRGDEGRSTLDILKERYARGEIGKKEFEEMKKELR
ncbi:SHOCT domain-containing protein [Candidatus Daviesbacteria bacterium]|nr:SHOCT domain-containing protein [Candidatus Daviesbacteria bacterium]